MKPYQYILELGPRHRLIECDRKMMGITQHQRLHVMQDNKIVPVGFLTADWPVKLLVYRPDDTDMHHYCKAMEQFLKSNGEIGKRKGFLYFPSKMDAIKFKLKFS